jgi:hypothetical protein
VKAFRLVRRITFQEKGVVEELRGPQAWSTLDWANGRDRLRRGFPKRTSTLMGCQGYGEAVIRSRYREVIPVQGRENPILG